MSKLNAGINEGEQHSYPKKKKKSTLSSNSCQAAIKDKKKWPEMEKGKMC